MCVDRGATRYPDRRRGGGGRRTLIVEVADHIAAITEARWLAERAGLVDRARFVEADVLRATDVLSPERYDIVYVNLGLLCWIPSVRQWAAQAASLLRPQGRL